MNTTALPSPSPMPGDAPPPLPQPTMARRLQLDLRRALIPLSLGLFFVLYFLFKVPLWVLGVLSLWMPLYYIILPGLAARQWRDFERDFALRFPRGEHAALLTRLRASLLLRYFGPEAPMLGKLGLLYMGLGKLREAEITLERGIQRADKQNRERLLVNLAHVKFKLGHLEDAATLYQRLLKNTPFANLATTRLAIIDLHKQRNLKEATARLRAALPNARGEERDLIQQALDATPPAP